LHVKFEQDKQFTAQTIFKNSAGVVAEMGARRIRENQKPPNSRNKNRQIEEPRLQILESLKNGIFEYNPSLYVKR